ncbi:MAG: hypothetical protein KGL39_56230 [Patescibacteria group bacterium]|nr:hypothetical protein [Patescibacteria group bacterium]
MSPLAPMNFGKGAAKSRRPASTFLSTPSPVEGETMSGFQFDELSGALGALQAQVRHLAEAIDRNYEESRDEHRKVHDIVVATSEAVRNLTREIAEIKPRAAEVPALKAMVEDEMKPLTDDYREKRAERRGAARLIYLVYIAVGGAIGAIMNRLLDIAQARMHP